MKKVIFLSLLCYLFPVFQFKEKSLEVDKKSVEKLYKKKNKREGFVGYSPPNKSFSMAYLLESNFMKEHENSLIQGTLMVEILWRV